MINLRHAVKHARSGNWARAHEMAQADDSLLGSWLHGILHIHEGDLDNAGYWYAKAHRNFAQHGTVEEELGKLEAELLD
ncbi:hypothetical protein Q9Q94_06070 [Uliginosibacterium sp. 31-16]|uniref:hypothetical protein n=1 Tax=Uliginosibacterium sp. 31-16 TaxID=3068315 RepID=UPI00273F8547|nr:hypothetical protein [Uliginosibacterium sp. 31-16]MDP5239088.1 hypothetical protein [Uliginosibacterium sp. 31-16]